jgi:hypothetical protein
MALQSQEQVLVLNFLDLFQGEFLPPLFIAIAQQNFSLFKKLIDVDPNSINYTDSLGNSDLCLYNPIKDEPVCMKCAPWVMSVLQST